ncbi:MAG: hypothetical protein ABIC36_03835 [bacterium]
MTWVWIVIGLVVVGGFVFWMKSKKEEGAGEMDEVDISQDNSIDASAVSDSTEEEVEEIPSDDEVEAPVIEDDSSDDLVGEEVPSVEPEILVAEEGEDTDEEENSL